jgi:hypothetical protein
MPITNHNGINREMTADEIAAYDELVSQIADQMAVDAQTQADAAAARSSARAKLKALGLTDDEITALIP